MEFILNYFPVDDLGIQSVNWQINKAKTKSIGRTNIMRHISFEYCYEISGQLASLMSKIITKK